MQEAKGSFNSYFRSPSGNKDQFTLRQEDGQTDEDFFARVRAFSELLAANGWSGWNAEAPARGGASAASRNGNPSTSSGQAPSASASQSFEVESIKLAAGGEHPRWVVKGGNFLKYGVTCWPEVLEAAGIADKLDPLKDNTPSGRWIAHYSERQNDEGRWAPDKVLRLERVEG